MSDTDRLFGKTLISLGDHVLSLSTEVGVMGTFEAGLFFLLGGSLGEGNMLLSWSRSCRLMNRMWFSFRSGICSSVDQEGPCSPARTHDAFANCW